MRKRTAEETAAYLAGYEAGRQVKRPTAPTPEREARASAVIGGERDGRKAKHGGRPMTLQECADAESVPPAAPQPATGKLPEVTIYAPDGSYLAIGGDYYDRRAAPQPATYQRLYESVSAERNRYFRIIEELIDKGVIDEDTLEPVSAPQTPAEPNFHYHTTILWNWGEEVVPCKICGWPHAAVPAPAQSVAASVTSDRTASLSVRGEVAEPTESAIIFGFESASDFEDSRLYELLSGCRAAALRARITWRAMNEDRRVEVDEWWRMLTDADWESLGEIPDDDDESFAEYQARIVATEARTLGGESASQCDHHDHKKDAAMQPQRPDRKDSVSVKVGGEP